MKLITLDLETWGLEMPYLLQPWRATEKEAGIVSLVAASDSKHVMKWDDSEPLFNFWNGINKLAGGEDTIICGWNLMFDLAWLIAVGGKPMYDFLNRFKFLDGMLLYRRLAGIYKTSNRSIKYNFLNKSSKSSALKTVLAQFQNEVDFKKVAGIDYKDNYNNVAFKAGLPEYGNKEMLKYNIRDVLYTHALTDFLIKQAKKYDLLQAIRESAVSLLFAKTWADGILIDKDVAKNIEEDISEALANTMEELNAVGITATILMSPKQLSEFLVNNYGIKLAVTDKGNASVNDSSIKSALMCAKNGRETAILKNILLAKSYETELRKFIKPALELPEIIHPQPFLQSTITGRLTYSVSQTSKVLKKYKNGKEVEVSKSIKTGLPLHQIKRGRLRKMFAAPDGYDLVEMDFAAQEMRIIAWLGNETTMLEFFNDGKDLHALMGSKLAGMSYDCFLKLKTLDETNFKYWRTVGKVTNLALQYRLSASGLCNHWNKVGIKKSLEEAERAKAAYLDLFPGIARYWAIETSFARNNGFIRNRAGRKIQITDWAYGDSWNSEQTAINFPVQSLGAEMKVLALYKLMPYLKTNGIFLKWDLHDGMYFYVPKCDVQHELLCGMRDIVDDIDYQKAWGSLPTVKFPVEIKIGENWADLEEIKF